ncbi:MAG: abortive infection system antitoxin AbiGi family protein [Dehalococcoidia bacterium]|nr:abortive infection system antitoxin AbiGi family protein [Dehalococcoidia bacterium]
MPSSQRYISRELTHFVGAKLKTDEDRYKLLKNILNTGLLRPPKLYDPALPEGDSVGFLIDHKKRISDNDMYTAAAVCFCDIPVGDLAIHMGKYKGFGVAFLKPFLIEKGANPVLYIAKNSRRTKAFDEVVDAFHRFIRSARLADVWGNLSEQEPRDIMYLRIFLELELFCFLKFFDANAADDHPDNFYMEREWRILREVHFTLDDVYRVIVPSAYAKRFRQDVPDYNGQVTFAD